MEFVFILITRSIYKMSRVFNAIDAAAPQGLEAMLMAIADTAKDEHDYETYSEAMRALKETRKPAKRPVRKQRKKTDPEKRAFYRESAEGYLRDGNIAGAAEQFQRAGDYKKATELYLQEGSEESIKNAIYLMVYEGVDYARGVMMTFEREGILHTHSLIMSSMQYARVDNETHHKAAEKFVKAAYQRIVDQVKNGLAKAGEPVPDTNSIKELLDGKDGTCTRYATDLTWLGYLDHFTILSDDPHVIRIALEFLDYERNHDRKSFKDDTSYDIRKMDLKTRMGGREAFPAAFYLWNFVHTSDEVTLREVAAGDLIDVFAKWGQYPAALQIAEMFPDKPMIHGYKRFNILKDMGDPQMLAVAYREAEMPIHYARVLAGLEV